MPVAMVYAHDLCVSFCRFCETETNFPVTELGGCEQLSIRRAMRMFLSILRNESNFPVTGSCGCEHLSIPGEQQTLFLRIRLPERIG